MCPYTEFRAYLVMYDWTLKMGHQCVVALLIMFSYCKNSQVLYWTFKTSSSSYCPSLRGKMYAPEINVPCACEGLGKRISSLNLLIIFHDNCYEHYVTGDQINALFLSYCYHKSQHSGSADLSAWQYVL